MATVLEPGHVPDPRNPRLKIQFLPATATFLKQIIFSIKSPHSCMTVTVDCIIKSEGCQNILPEWLITFRY